MRDTQLYQQILGPSEPRRVERIDLQVKERKVHVFVERPDGVAWPCPTRGKELAGYDHAEERLWRRLDTCQFQTLLHARIPRVECPEHGVVQAQAPWAEPHSRFTPLMERLTGFNNETRIKLKQLLTARAIPTSPFDVTPVRHARYARPELVAELEFHEWTEGGRLRQPSFKGLRTDKDPRTVVRETAIQ